MADSDRIAALERIVRVLVRDVEALRSELGGGAIAADEAPASAVSAEAIAETTLERPTVEGPAASPPRDWAPAAPTEPDVTQRARRARNLAHSQLDIESLVGRYGTIALASLTILMGTGVFLRWAVEHITLGPELRVALGALWAVIIAGVAVYLRLRGVRRFSNVLLALSLAVVHVDAWAAGPRLHVISPITALAIAAIASEWLAGFALREGEQTLFVVGVGGALLAPFVTAERGGDVRLLMLFGWIVIAGGLYALRSREWVVARRMLGVAGAGYVAAGLGMFLESDPMSKIVAPAMLGLVLAWTALVISSPRVRRGLALAFLGAAIGGSLFLVDKSLSMTAAAVAIAITLTSYAALRMPAQKAPAELLLGAAAIPMAALVVALAAFPDAYVTTGAALALGWAAFAFGMAMTVSEGAARGTHLCVAVLLSAIVPVLYFDGRGTPTIIALAAHALLFSLLLRRERTVLLALPVALSLGVASLWVEVMLSSRPAYVYAPFLGERSIAALACVVAWSAFGWIASRVDLRDMEPMTNSGRAVVRALGVVAAFFWVREELARAYSPDFAMFALIAYYAMAGVWTIYVGRRRGMAGARKIGLALAVYAALKALAQSSDVDNLVLRVGSYLLVGSFLLGVAYWYRATSPGEPEPPDPLQTGRSPATDAAAASAAPRS
ncbi:MAG: DUF2339 domain-containing protein [Gemmatimonadaceae bacterium]